MEGVRLKPFILLIASIVLLAWLSKLEEKYHGISEKTMEREQHADAAFTAAKSVRNTGDGSSR